MPTYTEEVQQDGSIARRYSDGSLRTSQGHWLERPPGAASVIDSERSQTLAVRRKELGLARKALAQEEAERALAKATRARTPAEGWGKLTGAVAKRVLSADEPLTGVVQAYKAVGQSAGMLQERGAPTQATQVVIQLSADATQALQSWGVEFPDVD